MFWRQQGQLFVEYMWWIMDQLDLAGEADTAKVQGKFWGQFFLNGDGGNGGCNGKRVEESRNL